MISLFLVCGLAAAVLVVCELARRDSSAGERARLEQLLAAHERERREWTRERQLLLNRIKPETAQFVSSDEPVHAPPAASLDDDGAYWAAVGEMSTAQLAEEMWKAELEERQTSGAA